MCTYWYLSIFTGKTKQESSVLFEEYSIIST